MSWTCHWAAGGHGAQPLSNHFQHAGCAFGRARSSPGSGRTFTRLDAHRNSAGWHEGRLREHARNSIRDRRTPAVIGTGWLNHHPVACGYAWQRRTIRRCFIFCWTEEVYDRWFHVNTGWGGSGYGWVEAGTWFAGEIRP